MARPWFLKEKDTVKYQPKTGFFKKKQEGVDTHTIILWVISAVFILFLVGITFTNFLPENEVKSDRCGCCDCFECTASISRKV